MTIFIFLIVLVLLIVSHELGHFLAAKWFNLRVDEFGFGFPPRLGSFRRGETIYSFNLIPLGGFVSIFGENPPAAALTGTENNRALINQPALIQAAVLIAGVIANLLLAWLLISVALGSGVPASVSAAPAGLVVTDPTLMITSVAAASPAAQAGLKPGDVVLSLTAAEIELTSPDISDVQDFIGRRAGQTINLRYARGNDKMLREARLKPLAGSSADRAVIGIGLDMVGWAKAPWPKNLFSGFLLTVELVKTSVVGLGQIIGGVFIRGESLLAAVVGPVGLAGLVGDARLIGWAYLLFFTAFISINLAIFNLIPFPALDGGRLLFLLIEKITGSRLSPRVTQIANFTGFFLLIIFMIFVTGNDLQKLF